MEFLKIFSLISSSFMILHSIFFKYVQKYLMISDPLIMMGFGILIGPHILNLLKYDYIISKQLVRYYSRGLLCIQTMAISLSIPSEYFFKQKKSIFYLVVLGGFIKCILIFILIFGLSSLNLHTCWAIAASLTPTDPILCSSILKNMNEIHNTLMTLLTAESGINDCFGLIMLNLSLEIFGPLKEIKIKKTNNFIKSDTKIKNIKICNSKYHYLYSLIGNNIFSKNNFISDKLYNYMLIGNKSLFINNSIYYLKMFCNFNNIPDIKYLDYKYISNNYSPSNYTDFNYSPSNYTDFNYLPSNYTDFNYLPSNYTDFNYSPSNYTDFNYSPSNYMLNESFDLQSKYFKIVRIIYSYLVLIVSFLLSTIVIKLIFSAIIGYILGFVVREMTTYMYSIESIKYEIVLFHAFALTLLGLCLADIFDGSELICIFGIGIALNKNSTYILERSNKRLSEIIETLFVNSFFILLGSIIKFNQISWQIVEIALICILITRIISVLAVKKRIPELISNKKALFIGWFGPIGVSSLYYCLIYDKKMSTKTFEIAVIIVFISVIIHGISNPIYLLFKKCKNYIIR